MDQVNTAVLLMKRIEKELVDLLKQLVQVPSVHPLHSDDMNITGEQRIADLLTELLQLKGFAVEQYAPEAGRPNVIGTYGSPDAHRTLLLEAHLDTVGVNAMDFAPFEGNVREGRLYGRGACDTKGPMAAALWALDEATLQRLKSAGYRVLYIGARGEEAGNEGALELVEHGICADEVIILEPTDLQIVCSHKGALWLRVTVHGRAAHGSNPDVGVNAIYGICKLIAHLRKDLAKQSESISSKMLSGPTLSVGNIHGGEAVNIVPERCSVDLDRRVLPEEDMDDILNHLEKTLEELRAAGDIVGFEISTLDRTSPFVSSTQPRIARMLLQGCLQAGRRSDIVGAPWYSDAGIFAPVCGETVVFGPGGISQAHTAGEYIDLEELQCGANALRRLFELLAAAETERKSGGIVCE